MEHIVSSSLGTIVAELATLPICTIKTNKILYPENSIPQIIKQIYSRSGLIGFYNSCLPAMSSQVISTTSKYTFYKLIQAKRGTRDDDLANNMLNGACGGIIGSFFSHPFDVMKVLKQNNQSIIKTFNTKIMYRGYSKSIIKSFMLGGLSFPLFDFSKKKVDNIVLATIITTIGSSVIIYPIEFMKVRHMALDEKIKIEVNIRKYYSGFCMHLARCIPHFMILMSVTEKIKHYINKPNP